MSDEAVRRRGIEIRLQAVPVVRIKLPDEHEPTRESAPRTVVGYRRGLSAEELWDRGRQDWKLKAQRTLDRDLALIAHKGMIRMVGTVEGVRKTAAGRLTIEGTPLPEHHLIGHPDPLDNEAGNPLTYGSVTLPR
ncbi:hypothetical protein [Streptomyces sp. NPDC058632]|uniref:hypothetical protein n=1 Tax=unclassified Streptomyces TaxID=2593676 RepID=UPI00365ADCE3